MKTYSMYYTTSRCNATLHLGNSSDPVSYYVRTKVFTMKPQLQLRAGPTKSAPMVAFARVQFLSKHLRIGTGDYENMPDSQLKYEEVRRDHNRLVRSDYEFDTAIGTNGVKKTYGWSRDTKNFTDTVYHCVDEQGNKVASLKSGGFFNWKKGGEIDVNEHLAKEHQELLIISAVGLWVAEAGWSVFQGYDSHKGGEVKAEEEAAHEQRYNTPPPEYDVKNAPAVPLVDDKKKT